MKEQENPYLRSYLESRGFIAPRNNPIALDARSRLEQLLKAHIPPDYRTADGVFKELVEKKDTQGIYLLYERGKQYDMLGKVVLYLFEDQLLEARRKNSNISPISVLSKLVTSQLVRKIRSQDDSTFQHFHINDFCEDVIGEGEVTRFHQSFQEMVHNVYGPDMNLSSPIKGLRGKVMSGILSLEQEEELEEWLIQKCDLIDKKKESFRESRQKWHLVLSEQTGDEVIDTDNIEFLRERIADYCQSNQIAKALDFYNRLPLNYKVSSTRDIFIAYLEKQNNDDAVKHLWQLRSDILSSNGDNEFKASLLSSIVWYHVLVADELGLEETLKNINPTGYRQIYQDLGIDDKQLSQLFLFCSYLPFAIGFKDLSGVEIEDLFNLKYRRQPFVEKGGRIYHDKMYANLLVARILVFGERGIRYPSADEYQHSVDIAKFLAIRYGLAGDHLNFIRWLNYLYNTSSDGNSAIKYVYDQLMEQT